MLLTLFIANILLSSVNTNEVDKKSKPYVVFPVPIELPFRNERAEQCWLRIEDIEVLETVAVYCYVAHAFLRNHIYDYNTRKMTEDDVDVSLWSEEPRNQEDITTKSSQKSSIVDWKFVTVLDPITHMRIYVTQNADCRLIMYSREAQTNYKVDCDKILYFINDRMTSGVQLRNTDTKLPVILLIGILFLVS